MTKLPSSLHDIAGDESKDLSTPARVGNDSIVPPSQEEVRGETPQAIMDREPRLAPVAVVDATRQQASIEPLQSPREEPRSVPHLGNAFNDLFKAFFIKTLNDVSGSP